MNFKEFSFFARETELIPRFCTLSDLLLMFRQCTTKSVVDYDLSSTNKNMESAAHLGVKDFERCCATMAIRFVRRGSRVLRTKEDNNHHLTSESIREKIMLLLKQIANSRGVEKNHVRFVSRMNNFQ